MSGKEDSKIQKLSNQGSTRDNSRNKLKEKNELN
jgi:hypothetical protein